MLRIWASSFISGFTAGAVDAAVDAMVMVECDLVRQ